MEQLIGQHVIDAIVKLYGIENVEIQLQKTRKEFQGDITLVVFPFLKASKKGPEQTANEIGEYFLKSCDSISAYNSVKGFLNLTIESAPIIPKDKARLFDMTLVIIKVIGGNNKKVIK